MATSNISGPRSTKPKPRGSSFSSARPMRSLRIALAGAEIGDVDWPVREKLRFADGTYAPTPWHEEPGYQEKHDEHFCHVSTEQAGKIAFTENAAKGEVDRQLVMSPGRYLHRFFSAHLDNITRSRAGAPGSRFNSRKMRSRSRRTPTKSRRFMSAVPQQLHVAWRRRLRELLPPGARLCRSRHGARLYRRLRRCPARSVVWPELKIYTSIYGECVRLKLLLENAGYAKGSLNGARIRRLVDGGSFVVPYIDAGDDLADDGEYLIIGHGEIPSENTNGLGDRCWYCPRCDRETTPHEDVYFGDGSSEEWCYNCFTDHTVFCAHNERSYSDAETFITVLADGDERRRA